VVMEGRCESKRTARTNILHLTLFIIVLVIVADAVVYY
jgi:hypothetical protein